MIPLRDDIPTRIVPVVNYFIIVSCVMVFLAQLSAPDDGEGLIYGYGMVPARLTGDTPTAIVDGNRVLRPAGAPVPPAAVSPWATVFTCMFLHGGFMHILGNMLFLYIFGDNVEDRYGHLGYVLMYVISGVVASLLHLASAPHSPIPTIGASGAIAGVMGAYLVMFPHARVMTLLPLGIFTQIVAVPAQFFLVLWFVMQLVSATSTTSDGAGVAFWAHVGGFVAGVGMTWLLQTVGIIRPIVRARPPVQAWGRQQLPWR